MIKVGNIISPIIGRLGWRGNPDREESFVNTAFTVYSPMIVIEFLSNLTDPPYWVRVLCSEGPLWVIYVPSAFHHHD